MTTTETAPASTAQSVRDHVAALPRGAEFRVSDVTAALPGHSKAAIRSGLAYLVNRGDLASNGMKGTGGRYKVPGKKAAKTPKPREEQKPLDVLDALPEDDVPVAIATRPTPTEIEIHKGASGGTAVFLPDNLPADGVWHEIFTLPPGFRVHIDRLVDNRQVLFIQRTE